MQRDFEMYLQKMDLMQITTAGRAITKKGKDYLDELEQDIPELKTDKLFLSKDKKAQKPVRIKLPAGVVTTMPDGFIPKKN